MGKITIDGHSLKLDAIEQIIHGKPALELSKESVKKIKKSRQVIETLLREEKAVYGVNTGFGKLSDTSIPKDKLLELQKNLILSHATNVGERLSTDEAKLMLVLRINSLIKGYSGVSQDLINFLLNMYHAGITPAVYQQGSVGASGDLAPLSQLGACMIGVGDADLNGQSMTADQALAKAGLKKYQFKEKEALSLINGTQFSLAITLNSVIRFKRLLKLADVIAACSIDGLLGSMKPFDLRLHRARPHIGQEIVARNLLKLLDKSEIVESHKDCKKVQDNYSVRCTPQVHGAVRTVLTHIEQILETEMNSGVDNPLVFSDDGDVISGGNFHGQILAFCADTLSSTATTIGNISERRTDALTTPEFSQLAPFLSKNPGLNCGFMSAQVAAASLTAENRTLCFPAGVMSIPTSAGKEDMVPMSPISARHFREILNNLEYIIAIEALCSCQALDLRKPLKPGRGVAAFHNYFRKSIPVLESDRYLRNDIEKAKKIIADPNIVRTVEKSIGKLE